MLTPKTPLWFVSSEGASVRNVGDYHLVNAVLILEVSNNFQSRTRRCLNSEKIVFSFQVSHPTISGLLKLETHENVNFFLEQQWGVLTKAPPLYAVLFMGRNTDSVLPFIVDTVTR